MKRAIFMSDMYVRRANHFLSWKEVGNGTSLPVLCGWLPAVKYSPEGAEEEKKNGWIFEAVAAHTPACT